MNSGEGKIIKTTGPGASQLLRIGKNLLIFVFLVFSLDYIAGQVLRHYYFQQKSGVLYATTYSLEAAKEDLLIFGSSRANRHYVPETFENDLKMSYYNAGRDGAGILYHTAVLSAILKRYRPKIIILDLNLTEFRKSSYPYDKLAFLLHYHQTHPEVRPIVDLRSRHEKLKLLSQIYPFNSCLIDIVLGNMKTDKEGRPENKGYSPLFKGWPLPIQEVDYSNDNKIDPVLVGYFGKFVSRAIDNGIQLYVIVSPSYRRFKGTSLSVKIAEEICLKNKVPFWDYSQSEYFLERRDFFQDTLHLNHEGALEFSKMVAQRIKQFREYLLKAN